MAKKNSAKNIKRDLEVLAEFIHVYCRENHSKALKKPFSAGGKAGEYLVEFQGKLCEQCSALLKYSASMRIVCPYDPKPGCKKCPTHCYRPGHREAIKEVMKFSGKYLIAHCRVDLALKYFF